MKCSNCGNDKLIVKDTRTDDNHVYRRRKCSKCGCIFYTTEILEDISDNTVSTRMSEIVREKYDR